ncbi:MAG: DNA polymerase III subunit delta [Candidatus Ryanbacteria bacterium CG10_big_fil_rev_8_21_14_0_10_43_42]|uniref:DNA-directed DNA polymerase n=1 Tax=Candidatus Ryanbacteria bacterium CG10_big_fil_rev_8_21_14_0_10_43_42 TaxID=1974864 RepID=A0A2M8KWI3_9BACT|nr:MAG: DNA polymerase III subunit delta [Candidatus Ryanbacteria bacterium CG10_big_fil_rev_8_21_14_0_10_43_42]
MLYFFYGDDTYRSRKKLREIEDRFHALMGGKEASVRIEAASEEIAYMRRTIETPSLFRDKRLIIIEGSREASADIREYVEERVPAYAADEDVYVLWERGLGDSCKKFVSLVKQYATKTQEFSSSSSVGIRSFLESELQRRKRTLPADKKQELLAYAGGDSWRLVNSLDKVLLEGDGDTHERVSGQKESNIFLFTDAVGMRKKDQAFQLFHQFKEEGMAPDQILRALAWHVRVLAVVADLVAHGERESDIARQAKLHPFVVKKAIMQSKKFSLAELSNFYNRLSLLDTKTKENRGDISLGLLDVLLAL